jgi:branched-chain amino acid aminotransferase
MVTTAATVNVNGTISDERQAVVSVFDHGFLYGEGVYEVLRTYGRRPFLLDRHLSRLRRSAGMIALGVPLTDDQLADRIAETIEHASRGTAPRETEWYIRMLLTRGVGELSYDPASCPAPSVVIIVKAHAEPPAVLYTNGVRVVFSSIVRNHPDTVNPMIKSNNLLNNALAMQEGFRRGAFEVIMRNYKGELAECAQSNFFTVKGGLALTPPLSVGLLPGITREFLWEVGKAAGVHVSEAIMFDDDLYAADEIFLTGTTREVMPIVEVEDRRIASGTPGPVTKRLLETFREMAHDRVKGQG